MGGEREKRTAVERTGKREAREEWKLRTTLRFRPLCGGVSVGVNSGNQSCLCNILISLMVNEPFLKREKNCWKRETENNLLAGE